MEPELSPEALELIKQIEEATKRLKQEDDLLRQLWADRYARHIAGPGADFLEGLTVDLEQADIEDVEITVDPGLGYEVRSAFTSGKQLVIATARSDGFVEAITFDIGYLPSDVGTLARPFHIWEFGGELRVRYSKAADKPSDRSPGA